MESRKQMGMPFKVSRDDKRTLVQQVLDGLKESIARGRYVAGDVLPSSRQMGPILGVSRIVTSAALERLVAEGWATSRPRIGCVVRDRAKKTWCGNLLVVCPEGDDNYFQHILIGVLRRRLAEVGYLVTVATVPLRVDGRYDFSYLDVALSVSVDLALVIFSRPEIFRRLARNHVPYCVFGELDDVPKGAVGLVRYDYGMAVPSFAAACLRADVRRVVQVGWHPLMCDAVPALKRVGIAARRVLLKPDFADGRVVGVRRAGMEFFQDLERRGRLDRETLYFVNDDNLVWGALAAFSHAGLCVPDDVRLAVWANRELGPVYPVPFARMEMDETAVGGILGAAVLAYLEKKAFPKGCVAGAVWVDGATMTPATGSVEHGMKRLKNNKQEV